MDLFIILFSIVVAILFARSALIERVLTATLGMEAISAFVGGIFFVTIFTVAPATVILAGLAQANNILFVAFFGGLGALLGDYIIYRFVRDRIADDVDYLMQNRGERLKAIFRRKIFRWMVPFVGAIIVASPLPDEVGLTMLGLSKFEKKYFIPLSFFLNAVGILIIGLIAKAI